MRLPAVRPGYPADPFMEDCSMALDPKGLKGLVDSTPDAPLLLDRAKHYGGRRLREKGVGSEVVYECSCTRKMVRTALTGARRS